MTLDVYGVADPWEDPTVAQVEKQEENVGDGKKRAKRLGDAVHPLPPVSLSDLHRGPEQHAGGR